ncbi:AAA family ATPase [Halalkalicoccus tibetensis]|uniref:AAA family ATPase n=1 Tax=Halalkalicoccus tibetensis TaxID=175632 RepID=A0ABD5V1K3_9EURY
MIALICGPPGAGKTTIVAGVAERLDARGSPLRVLHSDGFSANTYGQMYERVAGEGGDWLLDGTFYERGFRERFRALDDVYVVHVAASLETCLRRNRAREGSIDETGVYAIYREFERPRADLTVDTDELPVEEAVTRVVRAVERWRD